MKKTVLFFSISTLCVASFAQSNLASLQKLYGNSVGEPVNIYHNYPNDIQIPYATQSSEYLKASKTNENFDELKGTVIGNTTYDLQSNSSTPGRIQRTDDGKLAVTWTGSLENDLAFTDRGTFYNFYDGSTWGDAPQVRIENLRTGWPTNLILENFEVFVAHNPADAMGNFDNGDTLVVYRRDQVGSGAWSQVSTNVRLNGIWPRTAKGNGDTIHMVNSNYCGINGTGPDAEAFCNGYTQYWRSPDGGSTWDIPGVVLPGIDSASGYELLTGDIYAIDVQDSIVAISIGDRFSGWALWKSTDNGDSFTRISIRADIRPTFDTVATYLSDGAIEVIIQEDGTIHAWSGARTGVAGLTADGDTGIATSAIGNAILYWNENMGADSFNAITAVVDLNGSDNFDGIGQGTNTGTNFYGNTGIASMPAAAIDPSTGDLYLVYVAEVEFTDEAEDPSLSTSLSYRDLYGMYTKDSGATWSLPVNLTNSASEFYANVFPSVLRDTYEDKVHVVWQRDNSSAGHALQGSPPTGPIVDNEIVYHDFDFSAFEPVEPTAFFTYEYPGYGGEVEFQDSSTNFPHNWSWDFGDGKTKEGQDIGDYDFDENGTYEVCLTVNNNYTNLLTGQSHMAEDTYCEMITIVKVGIEDRSVLSDITTFPNPTEGIVNINLGKLSAADVNIKVLDMVGKEISGYDILKSSRSLNLNLNGFNSGVYFIELEYNNEVTTKKVTLF